MTAKFYAHRHHLFEWLAGRQLWRCVVPACRAKPDDRAKKLYSPTQQFMAEVRA